MRRRLRGRPRLAGLRTPLEVGALLLVLALQDASSANENPTIVVTGVPEDSRLAQRLLADGSAACEAASAWFRVKLEGEVRLRWANDLEELRFFGVNDPASVAGLARVSHGEIVLSGPALASRLVRIRPVLLHEFCHLYFARATAGADVAPPRWLDEGVAMWRSGDWDLGLELRSDRASLLEEAESASALMPFHDLEVSFPSGPFFHVAYTQSLSFVEWLIQQKGEEALRRLLALLDEDKDFEPAFASAYGLSLEDAEKAWRSSLRGGPLGFLPPSSVLIGGFWILLSLLLIAKFVRTRAQLYRAREQLEEIES